MDQTIVHPTNLSQTTNPNKNGLNQAKANETYEPEHECLQSVLLSSPLTLTLDVNPGTRRRSHRLQMVLLILGCLREEMTPDRMR